MKTKNEDMSDEEHPESEFYCPDSCPDGRDEGKNWQVLFVHALKSLNTTKKTSSDLNTFRCYLESIKRGNEKINNRALLARP